MERYWPIIARQKKLTADTNDTRITIVATPALAPTKYPKSVKPGSSLFRKKSPVITAQKKLVKSPAITANCNGAALNPMTESKASLDRRLRLYLECPAPRFGLSKENGVCRSPIQERSPRRILVVSGN